MNIIARLVRRWVISKAKRCGRGDREAHARMCRGALANCPPCRRLTAQTVAEGRLSLLGTCQRPWFLRLVDEGYAAYLGEAFKGCETPSKPPKHYDDCPCVCHSPTPPSKTMGAACDICGTETGGASRCAAHIFRQAHGQDFSPSPESMHGDPDPQRSCPHLTCPASGCRYL